MASSEDVQTATYKTAKEIALIITKEPASSFIILSLILLPIIFNLWQPHFPKIPSTIINSLLMVAWLIAAMLLRKELILWRRKTILENHLKIKKHKRHSIINLTEEGEWEGEFTKKNIDEILRVYPDVFRRTMVKNKGESLPGITLVSNISEEN